MLYTVTIVDDRNNQKLRGQHWAEVSDLFECSSHSDAYFQPGCAACIQHQDILDGLAHTGAYSQRVNVYSEYYGEFVNEYIAVEKEI